MSRRLARELALKVLYWYECGDGSIQEIINNILEKKKYKEEVKKFCQELVVKTINNLPEIDSEITDVLKNWEYKRISVIDKLILRMGVCEMLYFNNIPYEVSINEAIEIGKKYSTDESGRFINGILDTIREVNLKKRKNEGSNNKRYPFKS